LLATKGSQQQQTYLEHHDSLNQHGKRQP
jgi:hypothetical protein